MKNTCGHFSAFSGRTGVDYVTRRFNAYSAGQKPQGAGRTLRLHKSTQPTIPLKPEAKKTALSNYCLVLPRRLFLFLSGYSSIGVARAVGRNNCRAGASPARYLGSATGAVALQIALVLLACCFSPSAKAQTPPMSPGLDGIDCVTAYEVDEAPVQICEDSDPGNDLDEISLPEDKNGLIPSRQDHATPQFTTTTVTAIALRQPGIVPAFLLPTHFSDFFREHIRERAPPSLA